MYRVLVDFVMISTEVGNYPYIVDNKPVMNS